MGRPVVPVSYDIFKSGAVPVAGVVRKLALTAAGTVDIPQGASVVGVYVRNKTANAVTGGIKVGTTAGATDVIAALPVAASELAAGFVTDGKPKAASARTLFIDAVTAWNSASIDVAVEYIRLV
ncbi:hypothetical protein [Bradyrhizobium canariense]|uniref:hypothetical protein n=1 Tax=Bradyrhizobium canariense TaxID=255045 RepID=UPI000A195B99|nr:hypothetical protein [Bradyrhizobium canariense]OSI20086.1 hypothetical protein BST65_35250 [Bradyrhizobium canariense]OSI26159.1 hypothetical protein BST66_38015 [Bradyrhizobium canariense]OSI37672.1 hypothetical protein BSZ20_38045 [Bradyrhizobium canariense]OSI42420.1 hypothetical protein BST67_37395 [Bradyrhizobium canariense]OSI57275.1 hypothetical protein BSZ15_14410 [Bradyrhizobium canariense]